MLAHSKLSDISNNEIYKFISSGYADYLLNDQNRYYEDEANCNEINNTWFWWIFFKSAKA